MGKISDRLIQYLPDTPAYPELASAKGAKSLSTGSFGAGKARDEG
jgi:hypothetical protein